MGAFVFEHLDDIVDGELVVDRSVYGFQQIVAQSAALSKMHALAVVAVLHIHGFRSETIQ